MELTQARKALSSSGKLITQLWAWVPLTGMPYLFPASTLATLPQPPTKAARSPLMPPSGPWARRRPNSATPLPAAACATRAALVAMRVWKFTPLSMQVSSSWHCMRGPVTRSSGSRGKTTVPSGTASMSTSSSMPRSHSRKPASNSGAPLGALSPARYSMSPSSKPKLSMSSTTWSMPQLTA